MPSVNPSLVSDIRLASRELVRQFGFLNRTIAGTDLSASAVHAIIEVGRAKKISAKELSKRLMLEKSTISRLVKSLVERQEIRELHSRNDGRIKLLELTSEGQRTLKKINIFAETQVREALNQLSNKSQQGVLTGLQDYSQALKASSMIKNHSSSPEPVEICEGYAPPVIGRIIQMFLLYMSENYNFGAAFEARIATDISEFIARIDSSENQLWRAERNGEILGSIAIDGSNLGEGIGHLRWFVVDARLRGTGVGQALINSALEFCDKCGFAETQLWTIKGLDSARHIYEKNGFKLTEEYNGDQWGAEVVEQKFVRSGCL